MAKYTLLQMTQSILSSMDSDEINSIGDTTEAMQVVDIIKNTYNDLIATLDLPSQYELFNLQPSLNTAQPTVMYCPSNAINIMWIKYDQEKSGDNYKQFRDIKYLDQDSFLQRMYQISTLDTNTFTFQLSINSSQITIQGLNNQYPQYWTSWDNNIILFDSYDLTVDTTLQAQKSLAYGLMAPAAFQETDAFTPALDDQAFTMLINAAKAMAFAELKQTGHSIASARERRALIRSMNTKNTTPAHVPAIRNLPDYGRRRPSLQNPVNFGRNT